MFTRRRFVLALFLLSLFLLGGCLSGCTACEAGSLFADRGVDHCYQKLAVMTGDDSGCAKIPGTGFTGSNPPKDKCYLLVAEKNADPEPCSKIVGGMMSYSTDECYQSVGAKGGNADQCEGLSGTAQSECRTGVARGQNSEGNTPSCGAGYTWVAGGLGGGSCAKSPEAPAKPEAKPTDKAGTATAPGDSKSGTGTKGDAKPETTTVPTVPGTKPSSTTGTAPGTTDKSGSDKAGSTDKTSTKSSDSTKAATDTKADTTTKTDTEKSGTGDNKPFWEKVIDAVSGGTKTIDDAAKGAQDAAQSAADKVKDVFTGVDKNKQPTPDQEKGSRLSSTLDDVDDADMRDAIIKDFVREKQRRDTMTIDQQKELIADIRNRHEQNKRLDDLANTIKKETVDKATGKIDEAIEGAKDAAIDKVKDAVGGWVKDRVPDDLKGKLDKAQGAYDKAKDKMDALGEKVDAVKGVYDKAKGAYDAVKDVTDKVNTINDKVTSGKIDPGRAKVLKGGVLLGKGLETATKYIPVIGDTASTVTKETFGVVINVATKKAERGKKLDDCFSDPANCDTDGISGY